MLAGAVAQVIRVCLPELLALAALEVVAQVVARPHHQKMEPLVLQTLVEVVEVVPTMQVLAALEALASSS